jgi:N-acyl amino acid synthase of PEP-CTERM/exosortase system
MSSEISVIPAMSVRGSQGSQPIVVSEDRGRLKDTYESYFETSLVETEEQRRAAYRLRYEVYCVEHPYEDPAQNPNGMESDVHDSAALHALLTHRRSASVVGTARLILPRPGGGLIALPIRDVCRHEFILRDTPELPWAQAAEVSRFAISKNLRRRVDDQIGETTSVGSFSMGEDPRRVIPNASLGLIQATTAMMAKAGAKYLCAVMEPTLLRMLKRLGLHFTHLGPVVEYHGQRQPCYADWDVLLARVWLERPEIWELITNDGSLWPLNTAVVASLRAGVS